MLYRAYQAHADLMLPLRVGAASALPFLNGATPWANWPAARSTAAALELMALTRITHERPAYGITTAPAGNREVAVRERVALELPFGSLLHFEKDGAPEAPRVLVVAPLSGHFATLLRSTVTTLLADFDVYITDWHNARDVPAAAGTFGFDDYIRYVMRFLEHLGPGAHVVAVCQPCVQVLAAVAVMAERQNPAKPRTMTLMAGPIDTRINPTKVNELAMGRSIGWFERNLIATVPRRHKGAGRRVYPGFTQLSAFMSMNLARHLRAHIDLAHHIAHGERDKAAAIRQFYDEYFAVLDLAAEFYLETVQWVFQEARLAAGTLTFEGKPVRCDQIKRTSLLTVEGQRDDICSVGQTAAAHDLCNALSPTRKHHHVQIDVGHYGVFSGRKWDTQIYPLVHNMIAANS
jgi:polyhydroxyalkanoate depolymerase